MKIKNYDDGLNMYLYYVLERLEEYKHWIAEDAVNEIENFDGIDQEYCEVEYQAIIKLVDFIKPLRNDIANGQI